MADKIHLIISSREGVTHDGYASYVVLPSVDGPVGILSGHAPMLCVLEEGKIRCRRENGETEDIPTGSGLAEVSRNTISVLLN